MFSKKLYNCIRNCKFIIVQDIVDKRIIDKQIDFSIYIRVINKAIKLFNVHVYINKNINANVILNINKLNYKRKKSFFNLIENIYNYRIAILLLILIRANEY